MTSPIRKSTERRLRKRADAPLQQNEPAPHPLNSFFSFTYSTHEVHLAEGRTHVKAQRVEWADGHLKSERFEGVLPQEAFAQASLAMQRLVAGQAAFLLKQFGAFLPFARQPHAREERDPSDFDPTRSTP